MVSPIAPMFQWKDGKLKSPAEVAREQKIAEALMFAKPQGEGAWGALGQITSALSGSALDSRADASEQQGREAASNLFGGLGSGASTDAIAAALMDPAAAWASPAQSGVAEALLSSNLRQEDPMYQLQLQQAQLELEQMRNPPPQNSFLNVGNGMVFDQSTGEFVQNPYAQASGADLPSDIQEYQWYADAETVAGRVPLSYLDFVNAQKGGGLSVQTNPDGTTTITQGGPGKPLTETQSRDTVYATRAAGALPTIDAFEQSLLSISDDVASKVPYGSFFQGEEYQLASTAGKEFLASILRKDTGAAVTPSEEQNYGEVYLPRPGDKPARIAYKKQARARALAAIEAGIPPAGILAQERALERSGGTQPVVPGEETPQLIDWTEL